MVGHLAAAMLYYEDTMIHGQDQVQQVLVKKSTMDFLPWHMGLRAISYQVWLSIYLKETQSGRPGPESEAIRVANFPNRPSHPRSFYHAVPSRAV